MAKIKSRLHQKIWMGSFSCFPLLTLLGMVEQCKLFVLLDVVDVWISREVPGSCRDMVLLVLLGHISVCVSAMLLAKLRLKPLNPLLSSVYEARHDGPRGGHLCTC